MLCDVVVPHTALRSSYATSNTTPPNHRLKSSLSMNCRNSSVSVLHDTHHHPPKHLVVLDPRVLAIRNLPRIPKRRVLRHHARNIHRDHLPNPILIRPVDLSPCPAEPVKRELPLWTSAMRLPSPVSCFILKSLLARTGIFQRTHACRDPLLEWARHVSEENQA